MKAIRIYEHGEPDVMRYEDVAEPAPGAGEVMVQIAAVGVNPVETYIRAGLHTKRETPFILGTDAAGIVSAKGAEVAGFEIGERVYTSGSVSGTYAEYAVCRVRDVHKLPAHISDAEAACLGVPYATAYCALVLRGEAKAGEFVLVHGATGGVGLAAVQFAQGRDLKIIGTGGTQKGRALTFAQGADYVLDHTRENYLDEVMEITEGRGVDVVLEMLANVNLNRDLKILARSGRVVVVGNRGTVEINPRDLMSRDASIIGMSLMNATDAELEIIHEAIAEGLQDKSLKPVIGEELPLESAAEAHRKIMESGAYGKIVLMP
ncbi:MAG: NADPH:quinone reductase [Pyrinomonadaceae bacterium MAG19_C2-C3]|nr:NADPH:quinone reductase [Pyrinomonadaceae bacterium MAG19_C2-C3]